jgi:hypothetical protein
MHLNYLVWRFQFYAFVQDMTTFFADYLLRQDLTAVADEIHNRPKLFIYYDETRKVNPPLFTTFPIVSDIFVN